MQRRYESHLRQSVISHAQYRMSMKSSRIVFVFVVVAYNDISALLTKSKNPHRSRDHPAGSSAHVPVGSSSGRRADGCKTDVLLFGFVFFTEKTNKNVRH